MATPVVFFRGILFGEFVRDVSVNGKSVFEQVAHELFVFKYVKEHVGALESEKGLYIISAHK